MIKNFSPYIYNLFFILFSYGIFGQNLTLKITSENESENTFLQQLNFKKKHQTEKEVHKELELISEGLKNEGYFLNSIKSLNKKDTIYSANISLGLKVEKAIISIPPEYESLIGDLDFKDNKATLNINELSNFLGSISNKLDKEGKSFSEVRLKNIKLKNKKLFASLDIYQSKERIINDVIVKGYENFPKSFIKHYLNIRKGTVFNQGKLKEVSDAISLLNFVSEIKKPEVLFSKDSTILYVYIKKNKINNFDGLLNFASKENGEGLLFNGHLDLKLNNILNTGEQFELFWKANGEERQEFTLATQIPYIFNSSFSTDLSFKIYRQDSTFLNTKFNTGINYNISPRISAGITFESETSNNTLQVNTENTIKDFESTFYGTQFLYRIPKDDAFLNNKFLLHVNPTFGNRLSENVKINQFKINLKASYLWEFNRRNTVFIKNETGYLNSDNFTSNELYRIGGANSIRGFNEQSIFTSQYSFFNLEYRYLTSNSSYLYSITDLGFAKDINLNLENLYGLGIGYLFRVNNSQINIGYAIGKSSNTSFDFSNSKLILNFVSFF